ncbi:MAG: protein phosphatase 2C domain-containing protein, partial [Verrucomicrobia bacterium]|nr:protein phosphatase 2C domain-containing protein [Verrucomicrobiota bacterium]
MFIPREEVKLQPPTIAVTVPASAVISAPADKVKTAPPAVDSGKSEPPPKDDARLGTAMAERSGDTALASRGAEPAATPDRSAGGESGVALRFPPQSKTPSAPATTPPKPATWKNLPAKEPWCPPAIAAHAPELRKVAAADAVAFERVLPGWRAAGASRRGRMHANGGTHREDSLAFDAHDRATVLCVSDGAGSCQHSRIGSHVAAHRVVEVLLAVTEKVDPAIAADAAKLREHLS